MKEIYKRFEKDRFAKYCGIEVDVIDIGYAKAHVKVEEKHLNGVDVVQGGLVYTLADFVFACASNSYGPVALSLNTYISFMKSAHRDNVLIAEAKTVSLTRKTAVVDIEIRNENEIVAKMTGTAYRKNNCQ